MCHTLVVSSEKNSNMGRPKKHIDWDEVDKLLFIHCTHNEVAAWFNVHIDTLCNRCLDEKGMTFSEYSKQKTRRGKVSLRRRQYTKAVEEGNTTMLIWLGKQWLDQTDKIEQSIDPEKAKITLAYNPNEE